MSFGQYSAQARPRLSKSDMIAALGIEPKVTKLVARNTLRYMDAEGVEYTRFHDTDIIIRHVDGSISVDTGGWNTMTTRARLNEFLPRHRFYTGSGQLYIDGKPMNQRAQINPDGSVWTDVDRGADSYDSVRKHVDRYIKKLCKDGVPDGSNGDPWVIADRETGKYAPHLVLDWLGYTDSEAEPYVFQTFIWNALKWNGCTDLHAGMLMQRFNKDRHDRRYMCQKVRRYIRACLGFASS